jgi:hypothetical protein
MNVLALCAKEQDRKEWVIEKRKILSFFPCFNALTLPSPAKMNRGYG